MSANPPIISQALRNLVGDTYGIYIPPAFDRLEVLAAASHLACSLSKDDAPNRHHYIEAVALYLKTLPDEEGLAKVIISRDAAIVLGVPGLAQDRDAITTAREAMERAEADLRDAESREYQRLIRIGRIETEIVQAGAELEKWSVDYDAEIAAAESAILENHGLHNCSGKIDAIPYLQTLQRLAPTAIGRIKTRVAALKDELHELRGVDKKPSRASA